MRKYFLFLICTVVMPLAAERYVEPNSGLSIEIPDAYQYNDEESRVSPGQDNWSFAFKDSKQNVITIEIDAYDDMKSLPEHFHSSVTDEEEKSERLICEGLEFLNITLDGREYTKCKLRVLALSDKEIEPLCVCDYLFVNDHYGFSISLMTQEDFKANCLEDMMESILKSITFE